MVPTFLNDKNYVYVTFQVCRFLQLVRRVSRVEPIMKVVSIVV